MATKLRLAANLSFLFPEIKDLTAKYAAAKQAGFSGVECGCDVYQCAINELAKAREAARVSQVLLNAFCGKSYGLASVPGRDEEFRQCLELSIQYCNALKCKRLHILAGEYPKGVERTELMIESYKATYIANITYACQRLDNEHIVLLIEPISTIDNYFLTSAEQAVGIIKEINHPNLKLQLDLYHQQRTTGDVLEALTQYMQYIGHIQISQVPLRNEPCPRNDGEINYQLVYNLLLHKVQYSGWLGCEYRSSEELTPETRFQWLQNFVVLPT